MINPLRIKLSAKHIVAKRGKEGKEIVLVYNFMPTNNLEQKAKWLERLLFS
ncbi:MAG: hypothetical protein PX635_18740 [Nostocales cyanobacterium LE14-WE12]|jgi:hypothetical protein|nr:hypothetical protein [Nostocales cyanobacterium LE14-WE12]